MVVIVRVKLGISALLLGAIFIITTANVWGECAASNSSSGLSCSTHSFSPEESLPMRYPAHSMWAHQCPGDENGTGKLLVNRAPSQVELANRSAFNDTVNISNMPARADNLGLPNIVWKKCLGGTLDEDASDIRQASDGGYIVIGSTDSNDSDVSDNHGPSGTYDFWLVKMTPQGAIEWQKCLGGSGNDYGYSVWQTKDEGYIVAGTTDSFGAGFFDLWLVKTNESGNKIWDKTFGGADADGGYSVQQTSDDGYIITGWTDSYGNGWGDVWLIKTDSVGKEMWNKTFGESLSDTGSSIQQTSDGGYILAGHICRDDGYDEALLIKTDAYGNGIWNKTFNGSNASRGNSILQTSDGGYIFAGFALSSITCNAVTMEKCTNPCLVRTDAAGNHKWDKNFTWPSVTGNFLRANSVCLANGGGYITTGTKGDIFLIKTDENGNKTWDKSFGGSRLSWGNSVKQTSDGGYILAGGTSSSDNIFSDNHGRDDCWIAKLSEAILPEAVLPEVTNSRGATLVRARSARLNGKLTSTGGQNPTIHIFWGTRDGGTSAASWDHDENLGTLGLGAFYKDISSLNPGRVYYYRCYASNSAGSVWASSTTSFTTSRSVSIQAFKEAISLFRRR